MQPTPRRLITTQPQDPLHPKGTGTRLLTGNKPHRPEPQRQRFVRVLKDAPRRNRCLISTCRACDQPPFRQPSLRSSATWTNITLRPSQPEQVLSTRLFRSKPLLELHEITGVLFHEGTLYAHFLSRFVCICLVSNRLEPKAISRLWLQTDSEQIEDVLLIGFGDRH
jgi:hypothetical protein